MQLKLPAFALIATLAIAPAAAGETPEFTPEGVRAHVEFLADDLLEGRETGSVGYEIAARYVASRFDAMGLKPAGDGGDWFQRIAFQQNDRTATPGRVTIAGPAGVKSWAHATDVLVAMNQREAKLDVSAPLVFVGYGIENAEFGLDDYKGLDVKGKIVVALRGYPKGLPSEAGAHLSATKSKAAERHGAIGMISIGTRLSMKTRPWSQSVYYSAGPSVSWVGKDGKPFDEAPGIRAGASLNTPAAEAAFAGASRSLADILTEADREGGKPKGFPLKTSIRVQVESRAKQVTSPNIVAILPGSDPNLAGEYIVLSAHLDHLGPTPAKPGDPAKMDRINNGALDNAAGIATMLEVARAMAASPVKPRRSLIFLASTGEEKGLLGADYYARNPTVPIKKIVGNVDLDMPLLLYRFTDVNAFGAEHSTVAAIAAEAIAPMGLKVSPDPAPEENTFVRSDHYMFVKQGVPAVFLATGYANGGEAAWNAFTEKDYHRPSDDMAQKIDWIAGARFAEANYRITRALADHDAPPMWYEGDFFGNLFAPDRPKAPAPQK